jgi:DNA mismatch repair ATPase MutS
MYCNLLYINPDNRVIKSTPAKDRFIRDLKLDLLLEAVSENDHYLKALFKKLFLNPSVHTKEIKMRQEILSDAIHYQQFFKRVYLLSTEAMEEINNYGDTSHPGYDKIIPEAKKILTQCDIAFIYLAHLEALLQLITNYPASFSSPVLNGFLRQAQKKYTKSFLNETTEILNELMELKGLSEITIGGHPGFGLKLREVRLHTITGSNKATVKNKSKGPEKADAVILLDNSVLVNNSQEIINSSLVWILKTLSDFNRDLHDFFETVQEMFGFYAGALNLYQKVIKAEEIICFPEFMDVKGYNFTNLEDVGLVLKTQGPVVGNSFTFSDKNLCMITGANQGGKTTFLRSIGLAQLMAQCGLFVTASAFSCYIYSGIFTHFPDEEGRELRTGLLEQELQRLHNIIPLLDKNSLILMNETFSTTTEYDASYLAEEIIAAFRSYGILTFFVTHLFQFAHKLYEEAPKDCVFLRAVRAVDGSRSFLIEYGEPVKSGFALDLYHQILN